MEWHSDKPFLLGGAVAVSVGGATHLVAWWIEELVWFWATFSGSWFGAIGGAKGGCLGRCGGG